MKTIGISAIISGGHPPVLIGGSKRLAGSLTEPGLGQSGGSVPMVTGSHSASRSQHVAVVPKERNSLNPCKSTRLCNLNCRTLQKGYRRQELVYDEEPGDLAVLMDLFGQQLHSLVN